MNAVLARAVGAATFLAVASCASGGAAPGLSDGGLAACPSSPNCVVSEPGADEGHAIAAFGVETWASLPQAIGEAGGVIVGRTDDYLAAEFRSRMFGFTDDVEFRLADDAVHVRSASRVGYSDMGVNRKRVEALRALVAGPAAAGGD